MPSDQQHKRQRAILALLAHQELAYRRQSNNRAGQLLEFLDDAIATFMRTGFQSGNALQLLEFLDDAIATLTEINVGLLGEDLTKCQPWPDASWWAECRTRCWAFLTSTARREGQETGHDCVAEFTEITVKIGAILSTINLRTDNATAIHARIGS